MKLRTDPVGCKSCGTLLDAGRAQQENYCCPRCGLRACFVCGCTELNACVIIVNNRDKSSSQTYLCSWSENMPQACSTCFSRLAYELYQRVTGRAADDEYYMSNGRSMRAIL